MELFLLGPALATLFTLMICVASFERLVAAMLVDQEDFIGVALIFLLILNISWIQYAGPPFATPLRDVLCNLLLVTGLAFGALCIVVALWSAWWAGEKVISARIIGFTILVLWCDGVALAYVIDTVAKLVSPE